VPNYFEGVQVWAVDFRAHRCALGLIEQRSVILGRLRNNTLHALQSLPLSLVRLAFMGHVVSFVSACTLTNREGLHAGEVQSGVGDV
jgi:hypothetical protein